MKRLFTNAMSSWVLWVTLALGMTIAGALDSAARAGQSTDASRPQVVRSEKAAAVRPPTAEAQVLSVTKIRRGTHEGFTRVVLELGGPQEWSVDQAPVGPIRVIIPGVGLDSQVRRLDFPTGLVRSIQPFRRSGGVEVLVICEPAQVRVRTLTLTDPDRFVVDVTLADTRENGLAVAQGGATPAPSSTANASRTAGPPTPGGESPPPGVGERTSRAAGRPNPFRQGPPSGSTDSRPSETDAEATVSSLTVVLDPGHGGHDTGAIGPSGLLEKDVVLDLALRLRRLLQERLGVRVLMTRTEDVFVPLPERSAFANRVKADFLVSLHVNAANKRGAVGFETFFFTREPSDNDARASAQRENLVIENNGAAGKDLDSLLKSTLADMAVTRDMKESSQLAERILSSFEKILRVENRGVKSGPFYVLATAAMPAVLVESAFITNPREERKLQREDYRQRIARALFEGVAAYKIRYEQRLGLRNAPTGVGS
jgi:N-acetylmuramoyl-L-alanine amidase